MSSFNFSNDDCAYCRVTSYMSIYSQSVFKGEEKKALFQQHRNCELNDPAFRRCMDKINSVEWLTFINLILNSEERLPVDYDVHDYCDTTGLKLLSYGEKLVIFYLGNEELYRLIIYLRLPGNVDFQIMFSDENIEYNETDYDCADSFVECLNQQWKHSSKAFPNVLMDTDNNNCNFIMMRKFDDIHCTLGIDLRNPQPNVDPNDPDAIMKNTISQSYKTNFLLPDAITLSDVYQHLFMSEHSYDLDSM